MAYLDGRQRYSRPQAMLWANNPGSADVDGVFTPYGYEIGSSDPSPNDFLILSDHNRSDLDIKVDRIGKRDRMVNGGLRSYFIADKKKISVNWKMLPSRAYASSPNFDPETGLSSMTESSQYEYTADGGAGGVEMLDWYENNKSSFYVYLAYDKYNEFSGEQKYNHLAKYNEVLEMQITDFSYNVVKRGAAGFDFWDISVTLEEV